MKAPRAWATGTTPTAGRAARGPLPTRGDVRPEPRRRGRGGARSQPPVRRARARGSRRPSALPAGSSQTTSGPRWGRRHTSATPRTSGGGCGQRRRGRKSALPTSASQIGSGGGRLRARRLSRPGAPLRAACWSPSRGFLEKLRSPASEQGRAVGPVRSHFSLALCGRRRPALLLLRSSRIRIWLGFPCRSIKSVKNTFHL